MARRITDAKKSPAKTKEIGRGGLSGNYAVLSRYAVCFARLGSRQESSGEGERKGSLRNDNKQDLDGTNNYSIRRTGVSLCRVITLAGLFLLVSGVVLLITESSRHSTLALKTAISADKTAHY